MRFKLFLLVMALSFVFPLASTAGNIDSPGTQPSAGSGMYTLQGLYDYLLNGATPAISGIFQEPAEGPGSTGKTTKEIYDGVKALFDAATATADQVLAGATFFSTDPANWGPRVGAIPNNGAVSITPGATAQTIPAGYHDGSGSVSGDVDLVAGNIKTGVDVFGVTGTVIESSGDAAAADVLTGKTFSNATAAGVAGAMANRGAVNITPGTTAQTIAAGYHNGLGTVSGDADLVSTNIRSGMEVFGVTGTVTESVGDAVAANVLTGKAFSNSSDSGVLGTMPNRGAVNITPGTAAQPIAAGYHNGTGTVAGDADLVTGNIKSGVTLFDVSGDPNVVDTSSGDATSGDISSGKIAWVDGVQLTGTAYPAPVEKTGQTTCYDASGTTISCAGTGQDGEYQKGVTPPSPRFTDNGDGSVTDNMTGLIWLKDANCLETVGGVTKSTGDLIWTEALTWSNNLADGSCGLTDGSVVGDWRLPNCKELHSLLNLGNITPSLPVVHPFVNVQPTHYWSSTTNMNNTSYAWDVSMNYGNVYTYSKTNPFYVWPVRGGQ